MIEAVVEQVLKSQWVQFWSILASWWGQQEKILIMQKKEVADARITLTLSEASPGFFFGGGGTPRPLKGYHAPTAGGPGGEGPPDGSEVSFFQTMQSIRK